MTNFTITEAIFNEIQEVENNWEGYENNSYALTMLAYKEMDSTEVSENDDAVFETLDNIIFIGSIGKDSLLYGALVQWYEHKGKNMKENVRSFVEDNEKIYYVTGCGYDTIDSDLLGGNANGTTRKEFLQWINS
ncbi:MAG TPA: hypothetical protein VIH12_06950 [Solibacillus sp.]